MSLDIGHILDDWPYEHGQISARKIRGDDGREKIQLRLDVGLLQMEVSGRPDGMHPHGYESLLSYYEDALEKHRAPGGQVADFDLDERACELLRNEAVMYYHRYLAEFVLEEYPAVVRDTARNLRVMDLCREYAREESDRFALEQHRPYVVMMRTRAAALEGLMDNRPKAALEAVRQGVAEIEEYYQRFAQEEEMDASGELAILRALAKDIEGRVPADPINKIKNRLARAVHEERYEEAAMLRDQLRQLTGNELAGGGY